MPSLLMSHFAISGAEMLDNKGIQKIFLVNHLPSLVEESLPY
jgi:hypothetical protein